MPIKEGKRITKKSIGILLSLVLLLTMFGSGLIALAADGVNLSDDASDFVLLGEAVPDAILEIRYYSTYNFVGDRI
jgi:D-alanyl-D-alanine dipeptidase